MIGENIMKCRKCGCETLEGTEGCSICDAQQYRDSRKNKGILIAIASILSVAIAAGLDF